MNSFHLNKTYLKNLWTSILLLLLVITCNSTLFDSESIPGKIAITNVNVIPMDKDTVMINQTVVIDNGIIKSIHSSNSDYELDEYERINGNNKFLLPGFADMHTHVENESDLFPYIASGVTTILNLGSSPEILRIRKAIVEKEIVGPDVYAAAFMDSDRGFKSRNPKEAIENIDLIKKMGWDFIKVYNSLSTSTFDAIMKEANKNEIPVVGHGVREPGMPHVLESGVVMIAHMEEFIYTVFRNDVRYDLIPDVISMMKKNDAYVVPTISTYEAIMHQMDNKAGMDSLMSLEQMRWVRPSIKAQWRKNPRFINEKRDISPYFDLQQKMIEAFNEANIPMMTGTDTPFQGMIQGISLIREIELLSQSGLSNYQALSAATRIPGEFLAKYTSSPHGFGTIEIGNKANLIILNSNPLKDITAIRDQAGTVLRGNWYSRKILDSKLNILVKEFNLKN